MGFLSYIASAALIGVAANSVRKERRARREEEERAERLRREIEEEVRRDREEYEAWLRETEECRERNERRKRTPFRFYDDLSEEEFSRIVAESGRGIKRLISISCSASSVKGVVRSQSKLTEWTFWLDFNDWGRLTGSYWTTSENNDSVIPKVVGDRISSAVISRAKRVEPEPEGPPIEFISCPHCGAWVEADLSRCLQCGRPLRSDKKRAEREGSEKAGQPLMDDEKLRGSIIVFLVGMIVAVLALANVFA